MAEDTAERTDTIEWGATVAERQGWLGRLTAAAPPDEAPRPTRRRLRLNYVALGFAVVGFIGVVAGQYLPWMHLDFSSLTGGTSAEQRELDLTMGEIGLWQSLAYGVTLPLVFAGLALLLVSRETLRLPVAAAVLGLLAGQLALFAGMARAIEKGVGLGSLNQTSELPEKIASIGTGFTLSVVACAVLIVAAVLGARSPRPPRVKDEPAAAAEEEPIDLVVTSLPESAYRGDIGSDPASTHG